MGGIGVLNPGNGVQERLAAAVFPGSGAGRAGPEQLCVPRMSSGQVGRVKDIHTARSGSPGALTVWKDGNLGVTSQITSRVRVCARHLPYRHLSVAQNRVVCKSQEIGICRPIINGS